MLVMDAICMIESRAKINLLLVGDSVGLLAFEINFVAQEHTTEVKVIRGR
jgi:hypothetical protein